MKMKEKAVFFNRDKAVIERVYDGNLDVSEKLKNELEFPHEIIDLNNIEKFRDFTNECKYIFTTWNMINLSRADINKYFNKCEVIFYGAGSVQYFARNYLENGIKITSAWVQNGVAVAEFTVSQILLANKGYFNVAGKTKKPDDWWNLNRENGKNHKGNYNIKTGILGAGTIGKRVISYLQKLGIKTDILVYDPYFSEESAKAMNVKKASLEEIFSTCEIISNHVANLPSTVDMIDKTHFALMQDYTTFINTGRGAQIIESDMIDALKNNPTIMALLDVVEPEPPNPDSELYNMPNVILTPHIAGVFGNEVYRMSDCMYEEFKLYENEKRLDFEVTLEMLEYMA